MGLSHHEIKYKSSVATQFFVINHNGHKEEKKRERKNTSVQYKMFLNS